MRRKSCAFCIGGCGLRCYMMIFFDGLSERVALYSVMSLTHTQQVQRLYRSALRTAFDWAYHRYMLSPTSTFLSLSRLTAFLQRNIYGGSNAHSWHVRSLKVCLIRCEYSHHWPCTSVFMLSTRHAPDGQTLLKAGTIHLAQCVSVWTFALHVSLSNL